MLEFSVALDNFRGVSQLSIPQKLLPEPEQAHKPIQNAPKVENGGPQWPATKIPCLGLLLGGTGDFFPMGTILLTSSLPLH